MTKDLAAQISDLKKAIAAQESLRPALGDEVVEAALAVLLPQLAGLEKRAQAEKEREKRRMVTVLFADISGFTELSEKMDPEDVMSLMNQIWAQLDSLILARGGHIDKHMGDNVIALWGVEAAREDDAEQALRAALEMQSALQGAHAGLKLHIALHSGQVMLGEIGSQGEYTAMGRTINLVSHLEAVTPAGEIYLSHETLQLARGLFETEELPAQTLQGFSAALQFHRLLRPVPHIFRPRTRGIEGVETRMVGRHAELLLLQQACQQVFSSRKARALTVVGEAGLGKSRLLYEFEKWLDARPSPHITLKGRATEKSMPLPYGLLRDIFSQYFEIQENDPLPLARQKLESGILQTLGADALEKAHFIGQILGLDFSDSPFLRGILNDPGQIRDRARHHLAQFAAATAQRAPLMVLVEDLHWADSDSLDMFKEMVRASAGQAILFIGLARPTLFERQPEWGANVPFHQRVNLPPLDADASHELVREILQKMDKIPPRLLNVVVENAEGNPFYVEELLKMLIDAGVIQTGARWQADLTRLGTLAIPPTLTGILQARLDSLPEKERVSLQCASALGKIFWDEAVSVLSGESLAQTRQTLKALYARELIFPRASSTFAGMTEYVFKHAILREVTYETVLKRQRRGWHAQAAAWLAAQSGQRAPEVAILIAEHYERAEDFANAANWFGLAGDQAFEAYAPEAAVEVYGKAFRFVQEARLPLVPAAFRWYENFGKSLQARTDFSAAMQIYREMLAAAEKAQNDEAQSLAWYNISFLQDHQGETGASLASAQKAETCAARLKTESVLQARALNGQGWAHYHLGQAEEAEQAGLRALNICLRLPADPNSLREQAQTYQLLGAVYDLRGQFADSIDCEQKALETYRLLGDRRGTAAMLNNQGVGAFIRGDYAEAAQRYQEALTLAGEIGARDRESIFLSNLGGAKVRLGQYAAAELDLRKAIELAGSGLTHYIPLTYCFLAEACLGQEKASEAAQLAQRALHLAQESQQPDAEGAAWRALGDCACRCPTEKSLPAPQTCYAESLRIFSEIGSEADQARTLLAWSRWSGEKEKRERAEAIFARLGMKM
ncbi:MAG: adenylate/guanylate cyclase domain-containing protein [Anaerolineales bacterium]